MTAEAAAQTFDLKELFRTSGVAEILESLDRELIGLAPVKLRIRETAALLMVERVRNDAGWRMKRQPCI